MRMHVTAQCPFCTVVIRTPVALFSHRCRIALLAFAHLAFALLSSAAFFDSIFDLEPGHRPKPSNRTEIRFAKPLYSLALDEQSEI